jgi:hypothetical protein
VLYRRRYLSPRAVRKVLGDAYFADAGRMIRDSQHAFGIGLDRSAWPSKSRDSAADARTNDAAGSGSIIKAGATRA